MRREPEAEKRGVTRMGGGASVGGRRGKRRPRGAARLTAYPFVDDDEAVGHLRILHGGAAQEAQHVEDLVVLVDALETPPRGVVEFHVLVEDGEVRLLQEEVGVVVAQHVNGAALPMAQKQTHRGR